LDHNSAANYFNKIASDVGTSKLIALTENGAIPDIDSIAEDKSYWSYWMTWSQTWNGQFLDKTPKDMWKRNMEDERIVAIEDLPDWGSITTAYKNRARAVRDAGPFTLSANGTTLSVTVPTGNVNIAVYDMLGHFVVQLNRGILPKGTYSYSLESLAKGSYVIRAKAGAESRIEMLRVK
jgi:mannan endo-1,4-beta-mannosidase